MQNDMYSIKCTQLIQHHVQKRLPLRCILCRAKVSRMLLFLNFVNVSVKRWSVQVFRMFFFPQTGSTDQARPTRGTKWCQRRAAVAQVSLSFSSARSFFWQLTKQTWSALTETLLIKTVLVLRMVVVLVLIVIATPPRSVSGYNLGGSYISSSGSSYSFTSGIQSCRSCHPSKHISNSTWLILTKRAHSLIIVLLPSESDHYKITTIISIDYWPL